MYLLIQQRLINEQIDEIVDEQIDTQMNRLINNIIISYDNNIYSFDFCIINSRL